MSLKVVIPTPLRKFTAGAESVQVEAKTIQEVLDNPPLVDQLRRTGLLTCLKIVTA